MSELRNSIQLIGHLGKNVDVHTFENGKKKAEFTLATKERWTAKDGQPKEKTEWHNIIGWGKTAEWLEQHLVKGQKVVIKGKLTYRNFQHKAGHQVTVAEIVVDQFIPFEKPAA